MTRRRSATSHRKEVYYIVCIILVIGGIAGSLWIPGGYFEMRRMQHELEVQRNRVEALKQGNNEQLQAIRDLKSNPKALEKYARERGYAKKGEIVQQLPEPAPAVKK